MTCIALDGEDGVDLSGKGLTSAHSGLACSGTSYSGNAVSFGPVPSRKTKVCISGFEGLMEMEKDLVKVMEKEMDLEREMEMDLVKEMEMDLVKEMD